MRTDVSLTGPDRKIVIECKFYQKTLLTHRYGEQEKIRSQHLYQLYAYLQNLSRRSDQRVEGLLLYPKVGESIDFEFFVHGFPIRVLTVDLSTDFVAIGKRLLSICTAD
jgi:5-methylcytosine-specific restriction enzyme subunit McrC